MSTVVDGFGLEEVGYGMEYSTYTMETAVIDADELEALLADSFGPGGQAALIQQPTGRLTVTRSGWAMLKAVFEENRQSSSPTRRILLDCASNVENSLGDGVKCFVFLLAALLRNLQCFNGPSNRLPIQLVKLQMSLAQLTFTEHNASPFSNVADHCSKITSAFFCTRFPNLVSSVLEEVFHKWLISCLINVYDAESSDNILSTLQCLYKNFSVLCHYQNLGSRPVSDSHVVSGFLVGRAIANLPHPGARKVKVALFGEDSDVSFDVIDVECEVNRFLQAKQESVMGTVLVTSTILSDLMLFRLRHKDIAVLHGVPLSEAEYISSVLQTDVSVDVKSVVEGIKECTWLNLPHVSQLVLCGPTETLSSEYATACHSALKLLLITVQHDSLVRAGGYFERALHLQLTSKLEKHRQGPSVCTVVSRAELLLWHQQRQYLKNTAHPTDDSSSMCSYPLFNNITSHKVFSRVNEDVKSDVSECLILDISSKFSTLCNTNVNATGKPQLNGETASQKQACPDTILYNVNKSLGLCYKDGDLNRVAEAFCCVDRDVLAALAGSLLAVPRMLAPSQCCQKQEAYESVAFKVEIIQHVLAASSQILRIGSVLKLSRTCKTVESR